MIVFAAIAPHGDLDLAPDLRTAMEDLGRRFDAYLDGFSFNADDR